MNDTDQIDDAQTVARSIACGEYDADLALIREALRVRKESLTVALAITLRPGDRVKIVSGRPKYIIGATARVTDVMQKYCRIDLDEQHGNYRYGIRCPISMLKKL